MNPTAITRLVGAGFCASMLLWPDLAVGQPAPEKHDEPSQQESPAIRIPTGKTSALVIGGYAEVFYSLNFNEPSNGITNFRAFDNRHNTLALQSVVLDLGWTSRYVEARVALQAGLAGETYYRTSEPVLAGSTLTPASGPSLLRHIQQAYLVWSALPNRLVLDGGLFLSPIGPEGMATHENWTWSHSVLFFGLPFYHLGARIRWQPARMHMLRIGVYNGWNNALDNNAEKSLALEYKYQPASTLTVGVTYFTGVERPANAREGRAWRHLLDIYLVTTSLRRLAWLVNLNGGIEPNELGLSGWVAANAVLRVELLPWLFTAARGTLF